MNEKVINEEVVSKISSTLFRKRLQKVRVGDILLFVTEYNESITAKVIMKETWRGRKGGTYILFRDIHTNNEFEIMSVKNLPDWIVDVKSVIA
jgi:hypothetical protein